MAETRPLPVVFGTDRLTLHTVTQWDRRESSGAGIPPNFTVRLAACQGPATYWRIWRDGNLIPYFGATEVDGQGVIYHNQQSWSHFDKGGKFGHLSLLAHVVDSDMSWEWHQGDTPETVWTYPGMVAPGGIWVWTGGYSDDAYPTFTPTSTNTHPYPNDVAKDPRPPLSGVAHVRAVRYAAPNGDTLPRLEMEIRGKHRSGGANPSTSATPLDDDANPADVMVTLHTSSTFGIGLPSSIIEVNIGSDGTEASSFRRYCQAAGLYVSRAIVQATTVRELSADLLQATNSIIVQSEGRLKVRPLGDKVITGNGVTYTPHNESTAIGLDDIKGDVTCERASDADVYNVWPVVFRNRANMGNPYGEQTAEVIVQGDAIVRGIRRAGPTTNEWIKRESHARLLSQWLGARSVMRRNRYRFTLGPRHSLLEPGDFLSLTDANFGLAGKLCRLVSTEWANGEIQCVAEEWPGEPYGLQVVTHLTPGDGSSAPRPVRETISDENIRVALQNWQPHALPEPGALESYADIATMSGTTRVLAMTLGVSASTSDDGGVTWTEQTLSGSPLAVCASPSVWVHVGSDSSCYSSTDGLAWTSRTIPTGSYDAVVWTGTQFVAVGTNVCATSPNGTTWTARTIPAGGYIDVAWNGSLLMATGSSAACATSPDGITWTSRTAAATGTLAVGGGDGVFLVAGNVPTMTTDGVTWVTTAYPSGFTNGYRVRYAAGVFLVCGSVGSYQPAILATINGTDFEVLRPGLANDNAIRDVCYVDTLRRFIVIDGYGSATSLVVPVAG